MRNLETHDVFIALNIINSSGIRDEFEKMTLKVANNKNADLQALGIEFLISALGGCANEKTEKLIYKLFGGILEIDPETIEHMDPFELIENIKKLKEVINEDEVKAFFTSLKKLVQNQSF